MLNEDQIKLIHQLRVVFRDSAESFYSKTLDEIKAKINLAQYIGTDEEKANINTGIAIDLANDLLGLVAYKYICEDVVGSEAIYELAQDFEIMNDGCCGCCCGEDDDEEVSQSVSTPVKPSLKLVN